MRFANKYGFYELNPFPGCNQIVVSNHAFIYSPYRGKGFGRQQHIERLNKAKDLGYNLIICTVSKDNQQEIKMLEKNNWKAAEYFWNVETGHLVHVYMRELTNIPKLETPYTYY